METGAGAGADTHPARTTFNFLASLINGNTSKVLKV